METGKIREMILFVGLQVSQKESDDIEISYNELCLESRISANCLMLNEGCILRVELLGGGFWGKVFKLLNICL